MKYINHFIGTETLWQFGIMVMMTALITASIWLAFKVVSLRNGLEITLGLGSIAAGLASLSIIVLAIPEKYVVRIGFFLMIAIALLIVGIAVNVSRKKLA